MVIIQSVHSLTGKSYPIFIPGYTPDNPVIIPTSVTLNFLTVTSPETLFSMQENLESLVSSGVLSVDATITSAQLWAMASGNNGVTSLQADLNSPMIGSLTLASGTNIDLVETSGKITINSTAPSTFTPSTIRYVDAVNGSDSNLGGPTSPFQTIQAALNSVTSASTPSEWNNTITSRLLINVAPGTYTQTLSIPTLQIVAFELNDALIVGDVNWNFNNAVLTSGVIVASPKLIFHGNDFQPSYTGGQIAFTGIQGNLNILQSNASPTFATSIVMISKSGVTGNITFNIGSQVQAYSSELYIEDGMVIGNITNSGGVSTTVFAANCDTSGAKNLGGINGEVNLYVLRNVRFSNTIVTSGQSGGRWFNVSFPTLSHNFSSYTGTVFADANSYASFQANVPSRGSFPFVLLDASNGISYVPTSPSNWGTTVPTTVQQALDLLAIKNAPVS